MGDTKTIRPFVLKGHGSIAHSASPHDTYLRVDASSERASEFFMPGYQLRPSDRSKLNWSFKEHRGMVEKLDVILKDLKEHDFTPFQSNGLALKQGEKFVYT